ncbi:hypothetical protein BCR34DRAFT_473166 [Clohesyomyces aquaticus]|uniref:Pentatricopeptide repeat-containing protein-mitochondrial domain-containing protein n=1 Tax=Clohesyomyces aquaticus TaxID=1231657 RepID=A0A1Y2A801_9PLEO|nr:hypothetical protein BCR34DRAFT_473166 [Clohesyomyces aquaticus]
MPPSILNDALWKCLCPSFRTASIARKARTPRIPRMSSQAPSIAARTPTTNTPSRAHSTAASVQTRNPATRNPFHPSLASSKPPQPSLVHLPTPELYGRLRSDAAAGRYSDVFNIIKILVKDRREPPNLALYSALLRSFVGPEDGTGGKIRRVLDEMSEEGIELDTAACHYVIEALAVHPDYLLRNEILEYMQERWLSLNDKGHNLVVAGLLRDRLFEQALEKIDAMVQQHIAVAPWLYDTALYFLIDYGEVEEAYQLLLMRQNLSNGKPSAALWTHFLGCAARLHHAEAISYIWTTQVTPGYIKPPTTTCLNILNSCARTGNIALATDVFRVLAARGTTFTTHHYEPLLETYLRGNDLEAALSIVVIMAEAGIRVTAETLTALYLYLKSDSHSDANPSPDTDSSPAKNLTQTGENDARPALPLLAFTHLQSLSTSGKKIPIAAVNTCIAALISTTTTSTSSSLPTALSLYTTLPTLSLTPDIHTFNALFRGCHRSVPPRYTLAMHLASEMVALGIAPSALTYDRLVLVCCAAGEWEDAWRYYEEMRGGGFVPRRGMLERLIEGGVSRRDGRVRDVVRDMENLGFVARRGMREMVRGVFGEGEGEWEMGVDMEEVGRRDSRSGNSVG